MTSPAKLFSCVDNTSILKSPLNKSSAKSQYSFNKTQRFPMNKPYCDNIYNLGSMKMTRKTTFGYGKNTDLDYGKHPHNKSPSPDHYKIDSFVQSNKEHARGSSCHIGRAKVSANSYIELDRIKFPGPGRYDQFRYNQTPKYTMRPITKEDLYEKTTIRINPGPGAHNFTSQLNPQGKYYPAKFKSSGSKVWNPKTSQRFNKSSTDVPGSGTYQAPYNDMSDSGKYTLSQFHGKGKRKFDNQFRANFVDEPAKITKTPGPGTYRLPSDFGQYDKIKHRRGQSYLDD